MGLHILTFFVVVLFSFSVFAQTQKPIELFKDADGSSGPITIDSTDGSSPTDPYEFSPSDSNAFGGSFRLKYERAQSGILVGAKVNGKKVYFLFDTGATYTTLTSAIAKQVGAKPPKNGPSTTVMTANGPVQTQFGVIGSFEFGGRTHSGVTFTVCDTCPSGMYRGKPIVGLLGMNVLGRYRTSFDDDRGEIEMRPTNSYSNRKRDVTPFVRFENWSMFEGKKGLIGSFMIKNLGRRGIKDLVVRFDCPSGKFFRSPKTNVSGGKNKKIRFDLDYKCKRPQIDLETVRW